jgi:histidinol-phosphate aminotransferase
MKIDQKTADDIIKLSQNENPLGPSPKAMEAVKKSCINIYRYPEPHSHILRQKIANKINMDVEQVFVSAGMVEAIDIAIRNFVPDGCNMITGEVTFVAYKLLATVFGIDARYAKMKNYGIDVDEIISLYDENTKLIIIANPNNPTGTIISERELVKILDHVSPDTIVVADEAYHEYVKSADFPDTMKLQKRYANLVIMRTFSKIYGLAGLRVGYTIAAEEIIKQFDLYQAPFTVNHMAAEAVIAALEDDQFVAYSVEANTNGRSLLAKEFTKLGYHVVPSESNFLFVHFENRKQRDLIYDDLFSKNVLVRKTDFFGDDCAFRVTVAKPGNIQRIINHFRDSLKNVSDNF